MEEITIHPSFCFFFFWWVFFFSPFFAALCCLYGKFITKQHWGRWPNTWISSFGAIVINYSKVTPSPPSPSNLHHGLLLMNIITIEIDPTYRISIFIFCFHFLRRESKRIALIHHFNHAFSGFSAMLTESEASALSGIWSCLQAPFSFCLFQISNFPDSLTFVLFYYEGIVKLLYSLWALSSSNRNERALYF